MLNFDDYGLNEETNDLILSFATILGKCSISVMANRVNRVGINKLTIFRGNVNLHIDLVEGPFLGGRRPENVQQIYREIELQYKRLTEYGITPALVDFHQNSHKSINVMRALIKCSALTGKCQLRPLVQSRFIRKTFGLLFKNLGAQIAQLYLTGRSINFFPAEVISGLDKLPRARWDELIDKMYNEDNIIPCHPHYYVNERLFCEYIRDKNAVKR